MCGRRVRGNVKVVVVVVVITVALWRRCGGGVLAASGAEEGERMRLLAWVASVHSLR